MSFVIGESQLGSFDPDTQVLAADDVAETNFCPVNGIQASFRNLVMVRKYVPGRGHIIFVDFDPASGHEQALSRPALVLSVEAFNRRIRLALVAPITRRIRGHGFEVHLNGTKTHGAVLCQQIKIIDYRARGARYIEDTPDDIVQDTLAKVRTIVA